MSVQRALSPQNCSLLPCCSPGAFLSVCTYEGLGRAVSFALFVHAHIHIPTHNALTFFFEHNVPYTTIAPTRAGPPELSKPPTQLITPRPSLPHPPPPPCRRPRPRPSASARGPRARRGGGAKGRGSGRIWTAWRRARAPGRHGPALLSFGGVDVCLCKFMVDCRLYDRTPHDHGHPPANHTTHRHATRIHMYAPPTTACGAGSRSGKTGKRKRNSRRMNATGRRRGRGCWCLPLLLLLLVLRWRRRWWCEWSSSSSWVCGIVRWRLDQWRMR